ncbi:MAG: cytochrome c oxidase accessory protein CcoG [Ignavibacterium sp.]
MELGKTKQTSFRDSISTISKEGKRVWIYPKKTKGRYYNARTFVSIILLLILFITPFIKVNNNPIFLFNIFNRKFILFGMAFGPHDNSILVIAFITAIIFIILFTAVYGRLFCGWICPQTVFMEMVFRKIEYFIEGDAREQIKLNNTHLNGKKFFKKSLKHLIFFAISFLIANLLMSYLIGIDETLSIASQPPAAHISGFIAVVGFSFLFYFIFARFREQACIIVCPYGRLQSVLLDKNSIVVAYDNVRGEPRGKIKRNEERINGDCIDCRLCVDVCPTGIDIRDGIQLECVNCTACIDACDNVMDKIKKPRGLIKYASMNQITERKKFKFTPRIISYSIVLVLLLSILTYSITSRTEVEVEILRTPGMLYQEQPNNKISNLYNINIVNKTFDDFTLQLKTKEIPSEIKILGEPLKINSQGVYEGKFMIIFDKDQLKKLNTIITISILKDREEINQIQTSFLSNKGGL